MAPMNKRETVDVPDGQELTVRTLTENKND